MKTTFIKEHYTHRNMTVCADSRAVLGKSNKVLVVIATFPGSRRWNTPGRWKGRVLSPLVLDSCGVVGFFIEAEHVFLPGRSAAHTRTSVGN